MTVPWVRLWYSDWLADVAHLGVAEVGCYFLLAMQYYQTGRPLPRDLDRCTRICRATEPETRKAVEFVLTEYFVADNDPEYGDVWRHMRIETELEWSQEEHRKKTEKGRKGAAASNRKQAESRKKDTPQTARATPGRHSGVAQVTPEHRPSIARATPTRTIFRSLKGTGRAPLSSPWTTWCGRPASRCFCSRRRRRMSMWRSRACGAGSVGWRNDTGSRRWRRRSWMRRRSGRWTCGRGWLRRVNAFRRIDMSQAVASGRHPVSRGSWTASQTDDLAGVRRRVLEVFARFAVVFQGRWTTALESDAAFELAIAHWSPHVQRMSEAAVGMAFAEMDDGPRAWPPGPKAFRALGAAADVVRGPALPDLDAERRAIKAAALRDPLTARMLAEAERVRAEGAVVKSVSEAMRRLAAGLAARGSAAVVRARRAPPEQEPGEQEARAAVAADDARVRAEWAARREGVVHAG